jgi:hypothetical protein
MTDPGMSALLDQISAAGADLSHRVRTLAADRGLSLTDVRTDPWARGILAKVTAAALAAQLEFCPHVRHPRPVVTAAWRPGTITCGPCSGVFNLAHDPTEDARCDRCKRVVQPIFPSVIACGPLLLLCGLCKRCLRKTKGGTR